MLLTGDAGTGFNEGFDFVRRRCERDSDESEALNFLIEDNADCVDESEEEESGRLGVNGAGLVGFKGVMVGAIVVSTYIRRWHHSPTIKTRTVM